MLPISVIQASAPCNNGNSASDSHGETFIKTVTVPNQSKYVLFHIPS